MKKIFVIESVITGYWCKETNSFRLFTYATQFETEELALQQVPHALDLSACKIIPVYVND